MGFMRGRVSGGADAFAAARPARGAEGSNGASHLCLKRRRCLMIRTYDSGREVACQVQ